MGDERIAVSDSQITVRTPAGLTRREDCDDVKAAGDWAFLRKANGDPVLLMGCPICGSVFLLYRQKLSEALPLSVEEVIICPKNKCKFWIVVGKAVWRDLA